MFLAFILSPYSGELIRGAGVVHREALDFCTKSVINAWQRPCHILREGCTHMRKMIRPGMISLGLLCFLSTRAQAQQTLGSINGTVTDVSGGVLGKVTVKIHNSATNLEITAVTKDDGSFLAVGLPIGKYSVTFSRDGFKKEVHDLAFTEFLTRSAMTGSVGG